MLALRFHAWAAALAISFAAGIYSNAGWFLLSAALLIVAAWRTRQ